jgi:hypothetical protein
MGGDGLAAGMKMAEVLKNRSELLAVNQRIDGAAESMNKGLFDAKVGGLTALTPNETPPITYSDAKLSFNVGRDSNAALVSSHT